MRLVVSRKSNGSATTMSQSNETKPEETAAASAVAGPFQNDDEVIDVPDGDGIMIHLHPGGKVTLEFVRDKHYPNIHPNCYAPADLTDVHLLKGGGSGAAVFSGYNNELHSIVMKHGGSKDTKEVFALSTISLELIRRGEQHKAAAAYLRKRIPEFVMVYLSPHHVRDRAKELWMTLRNFSLQELLNAQISSEDPMGDMNAYEEDEHLPPPKSLETPSFSPRRSIYSPSSALTDLKDYKGTRRVAIVRGDQFEIHVYFRKVDFYVPGLRQDGSIVGGVSVLKALEEELVTEQDENRWKVTLAQKAIGGKDFENGAYILTSGKLRGKMLTKLMMEFTALLQNLNELAFPQERAGLDSVKKELEELKKSQDVTKVSKTVDKFVGTAIIKNYRPGTGRFPMLRDYGEQFRDETMFLTMEEAEPACFLGCLLERGVSLDRVFKEPPSSKCALDYFENNWLDLIEDATSFDRASVTERIWTCGLTDAGLHNTFLSETHGLELFDLGEPSVMPQPAFLTKFLMSFFHAFGMEETNGGWVVRFHVVDGLLSLTKETEAMIPYMYDAAHTVINHFIQYVFDGDERVRQLLAKYVVVQLLSDACFCLNRWEEKGGGVERYGDRASLSLDKWLWRSLWDLYIASSINERVLVGEPECPRDGNNI